LCSGNQLLMEIMLEQLIEFISVYNDVPHFSYTMVGRQTHDNANGLGIEDTPYLNMLKHLQRKKYLENTVLFFLGDHGIRYGGLRNTYQGRLEENLPALYVVFPSWFRKEYKNLYKNLISNSRKLTSNMDLFATFHDIINIGKGQVQYNYHGKYGVSLLRDIPADRTCEDLKIPHYFCTCGRYTKHNVTDPMVRNVSMFVVSSINRILVNVTKYCVTLRLVRIISSHINVAPPVKLSESIDTRIADYIVKIRVKPSNGIFEAGVRYDSSLNTMKLVGDISRLNVYRGQSNCVKNLNNGILLERYCFCRYRK